MELENQLLFVQQPQDQQEKQKYSCIYLKCNLIRIQVLGRAKDLTEFVKHGENEASIEIELKQDGPENTIIERRFNKREKGSKWKLNGKNAHFYLEILIIKDNHVHWKMLKNRLLY